MEPTTVTFDTLAASSALRTGGFTELQANALTEVIRDALRTVASKADLEKATTATRADLREVEHRLDAMDQRLDGMDQRLGGMDQRLDGMATKADLEKATLAFKARLKEVEHRLDQRLSAVALRLDNMPTKAELNRQLAIQTVLLGGFLGLLLTLLRLLG